MRRVDRQKFFYIVVFLTTVLLFLGCSSKEYTVSKRTFDANITKDKILHAVKRVFKVSDQDAFIIDSYRNEINITKPKAIYKVFTMDIVTDHFDFRISDNSSASDNFLVSDNSSISDNSTKKIEAFVSISRGYGPMSENRTYEDIDSNTYEIFWDRVEYLLGTKKSWKNCDNFTYEGPMCDMIDLDNFEDTKKELIDLNSTILEDNFSQENKKTSMHFDNKTKKIEILENKKEVENIYLEDLTQEELLKEEINKVEEKKEPLFNFDSNVTDLKKENKNKVEENNITKG